MVQASVELSGFEKASVLLASLGSQKSEEILRQLPPDQRRLLGAQITRLRSVESALCQRVLEEASRLISAGADTDSTKGPPLLWLEEHGPDLIAELLSGERLPSIALVIAHLSSRTAAAVLSRLDERTSGQVAHRIATMHGVSAHAAEAVDEVMRKRVAELAARPASSASGKATRVTIVPSSPEELVFLPDEDLANVLSSVDLADLRTVLRVASDELRSAILANLPEDVASRLRGGLEDASRIRVREVEAARVRLMQAARDALSRPEPAALAETTV